MAKAIYVQDDETIDYTPSSDVAAGDVVAQGDLVGVARKPIPANTLGSLAVEGVFDVVKAAVVFAAGAAIYWDADGNPVGGTAGSGAATTTASGNKFMGFAVVAAGETAERVRASLRSVESSSAETVSLSNLSDVGAVSYTAGRILVADGSQFDDVALSGDATLGGDGALTLNDAHSEQCVLLPVAALGAGADLAATVVFSHPRAGTLVSVGFLAVGTDFGTVDDGNTAVFAVTDGAGNAIVSKTYNTAMQPTANALNDLGALDVTHKVLTAGQVVKLAITNGATAKTPGGYLVLRFIPTNA
jgi:predicted RecA/RadA family phage recombinase